MKGAQPRRTITPWRGGLGVRLASLRSADTISTLIFKRSFAVKFDESRSKVGICNSNLSMQRSLLATSVFYRYVGVLCNGSTLTIFN